MAKYGAQYVIVELRDDVEGLPIEPSFGKRNVVYGGISWRGRLIASLTSFPPTGL